MRSASGQAAAKARRTRGRVSTILAAILIGERFDRAEPRRRATASLQGLLAPLERKDGWQLAEVAGDAGPDGVQEFLSRVRWDADAVQDDLRAYMGEHLGRAPGARTWARPMPCWCLTKPACLEAGHAFGRRAAPISGHLRAHRERAGRRVPGPRQPPRSHADRPCLYMPRAGRRTAPACGPPTCPMTSRLPPSRRWDWRCCSGRMKPSCRLPWIAGDSVYGAERAIRRWAEAKGIGTVLAVGTNQRLSLCRAADWFAAKAAVLPAATQM